MAGGYRKIKRSNKEGATKKKSFQHEKFPAVYVVPSGSGLFNFMIKSAFSSICPFYPLFVYYRGLTHFQIGILYSISNLLSCLFASIWHSVAQKLALKKTIILISLTWWILFMMPIVFLIPSESERCQVNISDYSNVTAKEDITTRLGILIPQSTFTIMAFALMIIGRIFQSVTDYFSNNHYYVQTVERVSPFIPLGSRDARLVHISTRLPGGLAAFFIGLTMDHVEFCNPALGEFRLSFYTFGVFMLLSIMILQFLDLHPNRTSAGRPTRKQPINGQPSNMLRIFPICNGLFIMGAASSMLDIYLLLQLYTLEVKYITMVTIYLARLVAETLFEASMYIWLKYLGSMEILFAALAALSMRCLAISGVVYVSAAWWLVIIEGLAAFTPVSVEMITNLFMAEQTGAYDDNGAGAMGYFFYFLLGGSTGPVFAGYVAKRATSNIAFQVMAILCVVGIVVIFGTQTIIGYQSRRTRKKQESETDDDCAEMTSLAREEMNSSE